MSERDAGCPLPVLTDFEDDVFRPKEQSFGELLGEIVNLNESPIRKHDRKN